ncbi:MAG: ABC transporter permease [Chloroflexi bacterium]|jgi:ABC-type dipeptide/oligopeptide/nickel transport system permease subunit|nr:ABC transporter permease [Chloroflexota bacterium]
MTAIADTLAKTTKQRQRSAFSDFWFRFRRNKVAMLGLVVIILEVLMAIFAPYLTPYDPIKPDYSQAWGFPNKAHIFGTDDLGRDVLSRLIYGSRVSVSIGFISQIVLLLIGLPLGAMAGLLGGWFDFLVMRLIDIISSVPTIFFYILMMVALGPGFQNIIISMSVTGWIGIARLVRGQVLSLKQTDYVRAAQAMGADTKHIVLKHIVRNSLSPVIVNLTLGVPGAMFTEAGLSFLGLGIRPPTPSWGQMIGQHQGYVQTFWHLTVFPALIMAFTMLAWMVVGDGIRDALDPSIQV